MKLAEGQLGDRAGDPDIPTLAAVLDPAELAKELSVVSFPQWQWDASQEIRLRVLRWRKASRCTLEIALSTSSGPQELIGKVYAEDRSDVYRTMEQIRKAGFDSEDEFAIPRPVAFLASMRLLLYEKVSGIQAKDFMLSPKESDRLLAGERCARWLARFHATGPRVGPVVHLSDHLMTLEGYERRLADLGRPFGDKARRLFEQLATTASSLGSIETCAGHGMYGPTQVLLAEGRTVTIDWDGYDVTDPTRDVARFIVALQRLALKYRGSLQALEETADRFLMTYVAAGRADVSRRLHVHQAAICLERAHHDVERQTRGWRERAEAMLDDGLRVLEAA